MYDALANSAEIIAGVLGIAVTVVAIIVELAATRYNHRITHLFIREPLNVVVLGFFVLTTLMCVWVGAASGPDGSQLLHVVTMAMITVSLLALLPYFFFVFSFISPLSVIRKLSRDSARLIRTAAARGSTEGREKVAKSVEELQDIMCSAVESSDREIAMDCVQALADLLIIYTAEKERLPDEWFSLGDYAAHDLDFVSLEPQVIARISAQHSWFEHKVLSQLHATLSLCIPRLREVAYLISIKTRQLAVSVASPGSALESLCVVNLNSYLRVSINLQDPRSAYYFLSQYRLVAEAFIERRDERALAEAAKRFQFYGQLGFNMGQPFLLEVCAFDLVQLLDRCIQAWADGIPNLLGVLLELDQEIRSEAQVESLAGVRQAQLQAAAMLLEAGRDKDAQSVIDDLATETQLRINRLISKLESEEDREYWELAPRGVNFSYLTPERRSYLNAVRERLAAS